VSKIDEELHTDTAPETEAKPVKKAAPKPAKPATQTDQARAVVRAKLKG
jgi:hypothetical protein